MDKILQEIISLQWQPWYIHFIDYINTQIEGVEQDILTKDKEKNKVQYSEHDILRDNRKFLIWLRDAVEDIKAHYVETTAQPRTDV